MGAKPTTTADVVMVSSYREEGATLATLFVARVGGLGFCNGSQW